MNNKRKSSLMYALFIAIALISSIMTVASAQIQYTITETPVITDDEAVLPAIHGDKVVYTFYGSGGDIEGISIYDLSTQQKTRIITGPEKSGGADIYGDRVVWTHCDGDKRDIYMYDISTGETIPVTNNGVSVSPRIYNDKIVYANSASVFHPKLYMYDISTSQEILISENGGGAVIYEDKIVWQYNRNLYIYDLSIGQITQLNNDRTLSSFDFYGDKIVWNDVKNYIHMYDISAQKDLIISHANHSEPSAIYGDRIVWSDSQNTTQDIVYNKSIYMYNISDGQITKITSGKNANNPAIYGDKVVWQYFHRNEVGFLHDLYVSTVTAKEVADVNVVADTTYRPYPNGYVFLNYANEKEYSWEHFCNIYGKNRVELGSGEHRPGASKFFDTHFKSTGNTGRCFGIAASSALLYINSINAWGTPEFNPVPDSWKGIGPYVFGYSPNTVSDYINYYQPLQYDEACVNEYSISISPDRVYDKLKSRMKSGWEQDPFILSFDLIDKNNGKLYSHTVVPYKIEEAGGFAKIYIYDPDNPCQLGSSDDPSDAKSWNKYLEVNLNTWKVSDYQNGWSTGINLDNLCLTTLSAIKQLPEIPDYIYDASTGASMCFTDALGNQMGEFPEGFRSNIPNACPLKTKGEAGSGSSMEAYYVPDPSVKIELCGASDGVSTVSILVPNGLITADVSVSSGSVDEFHLLDNGKGVEFKSGSGTPLLGLMVDAETSDSAQIVRVNLSQIEASGAVDLSNNNGVISVKNSGLPRVLDLYLEQIGTNPNSDDSIKGVAVEADSTILIKPSDWNDISNSQLNIEHDIGSDGTVDSTEIIRPGITPIIPKADFIPKHSKGLAPLTVNFTDKSRNDPTEWKWDFGDGIGHSDKQNPLYTYAKPGRYEVTLTVTNSAGTDTKTMKNCVDVRDVKEKNKK